MLEYIRIERFKAWRDTGPVRLAPLTVFFGTNSSGKSSIGQLLLLLRQTVESADSKRVFDFGNEKSMVDLGTFHDIAFAHRETDGIAFELGVAGPPWLHLRGADADRPTRERGPTRLLFRAEIGPAPGKRDLSVRSMEYLLTVGVPGTAWPQPRSGVSVSYRSTTDGGYVLQTEPFELRRAVGRPPKRLPPPLRFLGFPDAAISSYQTAEFARTLQLELETRLRVVFYVGPLREYPHRSYPWRGARPAEVGKTGEYTVDALIADEGRNLRRGRGGRYEPFQTVVARWLRELGVVESSEVRAIAEGRREYEVVTRTPGSNQDVLLPDVGFGLSQVLPVVVQCFYAPPGSTTILEQPEIHLHPAVQSNMADLFIDAIHAWEGGKRRSTQLIVESHSEHLLRRIQRRVAEGVIGADEVALYFCRNTPSGAELRPLEIDAEGNITNWPERFFGDDMEDLVAMAEASAGGAGAPAT